MLVGIPAQCIENVWATVAPMLQRAIDKSQHDYNIHDIFKCLTERDMQLWVWIEDSKIIACCVTLIITYPRRKICQLPYIAGKGLRNWVLSEPVIIEWAKSQGCTKLEGFDRGGWLRVLTGWFKVWTTIRKDI